MSDKPTEDDPDLAETVESEDVRDDGEPFQLEDDLAECWLCECGNFIEDGLHCPDCGREPPWGCPCSECQMPDENFEDDDYYPWDIP